MQNNQLISEPKTEPKKNGHKINQNETSPRILQMINSIAVTQLLKSVREPHIFE